MFVQVADGFVGFKSNDDKQVVAFCGETEIIIPIVILRSFLEAYKACSLVERSEV